MTKFVMQNGEYRVFSNGSLNVSDSLPSGTYTINIDPKTNEYFLSPIEGYSLGKLYGEVEKQSERILNTFKDRKVSTGVLLAGEKGCGKTMLAKKISIDALSHGIPSIVINRPLSGESFNRFIQSIEQPCVIIFDEYEKVYGDREDQEMLLTLLDGVYPTKKLFILTTNDMRGINTHMINRPGRLFYKLIYKGLGEDFIKQYCDDVLVNKSYIDDIIKLSKVFEHFNFDMLKALVEEMNRYNESPRDAIKMMNIYPDMSDYDNYEIIIFKNDKKMTSDGRDSHHINPFEPFTISFRSTDEDGEEVWENVKITPTMISSIRGSNYVFTTDNITVNVNKINDRFEKDVFDLAF